MVPINKKKKKNLQIIKLTYKPQAQTPGELAAHMASLLQTATDADAGTIFAVDDDGMLVAWLRDEPGAGEYVQPAPTTGGEAAPSARTPSARLAAAPLAPVFTPVRLAGRGLLGHAVTTRRALSVADVASHPLADDIVGSVMLRVMAAAAIGKRTAASIGSMMCIPLVAEGRVAGVAMALRSKKGYVARHENRCFDNNKNPRKEISQKKKKKKKTTSDPAAAPFPSTISRSL
jgi:GAF domain-containing protein